MKNINAFLTLDKVFNNSHNRENLIVVFLDDDTSAVEPNFNGKVEVAFIETNDYSHPLLDLASEDPEDSEILSLKKELEHIDDNYIYRGVISTDSMGEMQFEYNGVTVSTDLFI